MSKRDMVVIIILSCAVVLFLLIYVPVKTELLTLLVVDHETDLPLPGITVYYRLTKVRSIWFIEVRYITIDTKKLKTSSKGEIVIPSRTYLLRRDEAFSDKSFYINIGKKIKWLPWDGELFKFGNRFPNTGRDIADIVLIDKTYSATAVHIFDYNAGRDNSDFRAGFFRYELDLPFNEEIKLTVQLAKNAD